MKVMPGEVMEQGARSKEQSMRLLLAWTSSSVDPIRLVCCYICNSFSLGPGCCVLGVGTSVVGVKSRGDTWCCEEVISRLAEDKAAYLILENWCCPITGFPSL